MANKKATTAGFNRPSLSNVGATGLSVNTFSYGNFKDDGAAWDEQAAIAASGFFNDAVLVLPKGSMILASDGIAAVLYCVTSDTGETPVTVA